jgi:hypothetical protein
LEQRDPEFEPKMAEILCVYRQVAMLRSEAAKGQDSGGGLVIVSITIGFGRMMARRAVTKS